MAELEAGRVIGAYRIVRRIGQGGMGTVYEVEHVELGVHYALKTYTFDPESDVNHALKRKFLEEGKMLARLKHPGIAHVFDLAFDEETQTPYFVMDLVTYEDGEPHTAEDVAREDIDEELVLKWFTEVASALDYIHGEGIVHQDVKPANLLLDKDLHVILTDFGISHIFGTKMKTDVGATRTMISKPGHDTLVRGTENYMAPEVENGDPASPEADAYSLGVMTLRWLTGFFYKDNPGALGLLGKMKYRWVPVLAQLLAPTPDRRPKTYSDLVAQLKPIAKGGAGAPRTPQMPPERKRAKKRKETQMALLIAAGVLALVCGAGWFVYQAWSKYEDDKKANAAKVAAIQQQMRDKEAAEAKAKAEAQAAEARRIAEEKRLAEEKAKAEAERKAAALKKRQEEEAARIRIAKKNAEAEKAQPAPAPKPEEKREFVQEAVVTEVKDYGPIPKKKYAWLRNGNPDDPQRHTFELANGAKLELMPLTADTFYMPGGSRSRGWHQVTLTRPFWMTRTCITVDQWREYAPNDCEDCHEVEKALGNKALLYIKLNRKAVDDYCARLTAKYSSQLPKGYVFRLPSEAEWVRAYDEDSCANHLGDNWLSQLLMDGSAAQEKLAKIRTQVGGKTFESFSGQGWSILTRYQIGGMTQPTPTGILDLCDTWRAVCYWRLALDVVSPRGGDGYSDSEVDPLRWHEGLYDNYQARTLARAYDQGGCLGFDRLCICHIVLGPDLIAEKAWNNERKNVDLSKVIAPDQKTKFDLKKIPRKCNPKKPHEVSFKRVGGKEMVFCGVSKAKFNMSNADGQSKSFHRVELTHPFWMSKFCVTADEWREFAPNDFCTWDVRTCEKLFPKNPIAVVNNYWRWTAYCDFLTKRYGHLLPEGYVFRLPTEAEWEWAYVSDEKNNIHNMPRDCGSEDDRLRNEFQELLKRVHAPKGLMHDATLGTTQRAYVGGRTRATGFGVFDIYVWDWKFPLMLDTFDTRPCDRDGNASSDQNLAYEDKEVDPIRYAGRCANFAETRAQSSCRRIKAMNHCGVAHIVIAPDILKPIKEKEVAEFPAEDFGGVFLGHLVKRVDQSSRYKGHRNSDDEIKRMASRENLIAARFDKGEETRGFRTNKEDAPWILLDLGKRCTLTGLAIDDFFGDCTRNLCIWVSDDGKHEKLVDKEDRIRKRYRIDLQKKDVKGRYIRLGLEAKPEKNVLQFDKVVIYGKE